MKTFILFIATILVVPLWATTFAPVAFEKQLREGDGVIEGQFLTASTIRTDDDQVLTRATFSVKRSVGFFEGEIANKQRLIVVYPGGNWQGINYSVPGAPKFKNGEEVFLVLSKSQYGYTLSNLALSKYKIEWLDGEKQLVSEVFPDHHELGKIPFSKVEKNIHAVYGHGMNEIKNDRHVAMGEIEATPTMKPTGRAPSSVEPEVVPQSSGMKVGFWLAVLFGILGILSVWFARQRR